MSGTFLWLLTPIIELSQTRLCFALSTFFSFLLKLEMIHFFPFPGYGHATKLLRFAANGIRTDDFLRLPANHWYDSRFAANADRTACTGRDAQ